MRKKNILLGMVLVVGIVFTGCGQNTNMDVTRVQQENVQDENAYKMEADAPKDSEDVTAAETEAQKQAEMEAQKAEEAQKLAEEEALKAAEEAKKQEAANDTSGNMITEEEAINVVLKKVDGATKSDVKIEKEYDDGYWKYEGEIHHNHKEYEFELNAENGKIMEWSVECIHD